MLGNGHVQEEIGLLTGRAMKGEMTQPNAACPCSESPALALAGEGRLSTTVTPPMLSDLTGCKRRSLNTSSAIRRVSGIIPWRAPWRPSWQQAWLLGRGQLLQASWLQAWQKRGRAQLHSRCHHLPLPVRSLTEGMHSRVCQSLCCHQPFTLACKFLRAALATPHRSLL